MSGFGSVIGFMFSFFTIMLIFIALFFGYQAQLEEQFQLFSGEDSNTYLEQLRSDMELKGAIRDSGRWYLRLKNTGDEELLLERGAASCFSAFVDERFVAQEDLSVHIPGPLDARYRMIEPGSEGFLILDTPVDRDGTRFEITSCGGMERNLTLSQGNEDWWDRDWKKRKTYLVSQPVSGDSLREFQIPVTINGSEFDFSRLSRDELRFVASLKEFYLLRLPFDEHAQELQDTSKYDHQTISGSTQGEDGGDPSPRRGVLFDALQFDGNDSVTVSSSEELAPRNSLSLELWVAPEASVGQSQVIAHQPGGFELSLRNDSTPGSLLLTFQTDSGNLTLNTSSALKKDHWSHVALTYSPEAAKLFVDGEKRANLSPGGARLLAREGNVTFGADQTGVGGLIGGLDEVSLYPFALTENEVRSRYEGVPVSLSLPFRISRWDEAEQKALAQVQVPHIGNNSNISFSVYYDTKEEVASQEDEKETFSYSSPRTMGYLVSDSLVSDGITITGFFNDSLVEIGNQRYVLDSFDTVSVNSGLNRGDEIRTTKPVQIEGSSEEDATIAPLAAAGEEFVVLTGLSSQELCLLSPYTSTSIDLYVDGSFNRSIATDSGGTCLTTSFSADTHLRFDGVLPYLVHYRESDGASHYEEVLWPTTHEPLYGVPSETLTLLSGEDSSVVLNRNSEATLRTEDLNADDVITRTGLGSEGQAPAYKLDGDEEVMAYQSFDGDTSEDFTTFAREQEMGERFAAGRGLSYLAAASSYGNANCSLYDDTGLLTTQETGTGKDGLFRYRFQVSLSEGTAWQLRCDRPVWLYYAPASAGERNVLGMAQNRQETFPAPAVELIGYDRVFKQYS